MERVGKKAVRARCTRAVFVRVGSVPAQFCTAVESVGDEEWAVVDRTLTDSELSWGSLLPRGTGPAPSTDSGSCWLLAGPPAEQHGLLRHHPVTVRTNRANGWGGWLV